MDGRSYLYSIGKQNPLRHLLDGRRNQPISWQFKVTFFSFLPLPEKITRKIIAAERMQTAESWISDILYIILQNKFVVKPFKRKKGDPRKGASLILQNLAFQHRPRKRIASKFPLG
jgi:hypothetical protein